MPADTERQRVEGLLFYTVLAILGYLVYQIFRPFLVALGRAMLLAVFCGPMNR